MDTKMRLIVFQMLFCYGVLSGAQGETGTPMSHHQVGDDAWAQFNSDMMKMHVAMAEIKTSGSADEDFVRLMLPHHQSAIDMAETELRFGRDPQMRRLAQEIVADQQSEVDVMRLWLKDHRSSSTGTPVKSGKEGR